MENLYKEEALNYYNEWRHHIHSGQYDWGQMTDRLDYLQKAVQRLGITEGHEDYNDCQDLLEKIQLNLDCCPASRK
tara:strand:+ start:107 stop:334 length:228 start_codon:yes stop_codon:yes gene_type:complete